MTNHKIISNVLTESEHNYFLEWALDPTNIHRGNATDGKYYDSHDGLRDYNVWWTTQPDASSWKSIVKKLTPHISMLMNDHQWSVYNVDCITTRPASAKIHAHIDFPYKFYETRSMTGVLGVQIIIPLHDFTVENGGTMYMPELIGVDAYMIEQYQTEFNEYLLAHGNQLVAPAGTALMYDGKTLHSTMPNNSNNFRSALLINVLRNDCIDLVLRNDVNTDHSTRNFYNNETINT